ncbi:ASCH domain-containing protein [Bacillus thermocopriae]|uniref:ASCH domain-containing protein n=1 Tax=Neobacillus thermocopriae TaxID=1215031 RepID=A0A6B3TS96_9BACI|nr:ASCH domain-containing protein [Neobacillus thermocopriae]MED3623495.1 ASCH domain-containing protein [Neobacillus thermocopriae]MED3715241.1 ASCH domain-containing protein [Neobacillus thermocopriae]NEX79522.1 ASCH domain-containing protein [Neobacillus thermocopriae]
MNRVQQFWNDFCVATGQEGIKYKDAFQFGVSPDWLADLVIKGKKTATTSGFIFYELEKEEIPKTGEYYIILDGKEEPVAVIQIESVEVVPMNEVTEEFALAEGEGDYQNWWEAHEKFFTESLREYDMEFSPSMLVVCERFKKVYPL